MLANTLSNESTGLPLPAVAEKKPMPAVSTSRTGRTVTKQAASKSVMPSSLNNIARKISIYIRSAKKCTLITYYLIKHIIFKRPLNTPEKLENLINNVGATLIKTFQPLFDNDQFVDGVFKKSIQSNGKLSTTEVHKKIEELKKTLRKTLSDNKCIVSTESAQKTLNNKYGKKYNIEKNLGTGTIASCFEVTKSDGSKAVAKVVMQESIDDLEISRTVIKFLFFILAKSKHEFTTKILSGLKRFSDETNLEKEHIRQEQYKDLISKSQPGTEVIIENKKIFENPLKLKLSFSVPKVIEKDSSKGVLVMEKVDGLSLNKLKAAPNTLLHLKPELEKTVGFNLDETQFNEIITELVKAIKKESDKKWHEIMLKHDIVHGDFHSGNIMVSFNKENKITISFLDHPRNIKLEEGLKNYLKKSIEIIDEFTNIQTNKKAKEIETEDLDSFKTVQIIATILHLAESFKNGSKNEKLLDKISTEEKELLNRMYDHLVSKYGIQNPKQEDKKNCLAVIYKVLEIFRLHGGWQSIDPEFGNVLYTLLFTLLDEKVLSCSDSLKSLFSALAHGNIYFNPDYSVLPDN